MARKKIVQGVLLAALLLGLALIRYEAEPFAAAAAPPADRKPAPDFMLKDANGKDVKLSSLKGKVVLLNFWATWCGPCKVEIPWFIDFQKMYENRGFTVVGVSMDEDGWKVVKPYIETRGMNYPVLLGNEQVAKEYEGLDALPTTLILDRHGKIDARHMGLVAKSVYDKEIQQLLAERP